MHPTLLYLIRLRTWAWFRHTARGMRSLKRAVFIVFAGIMILLWLGPQLAMAAFRPDPDIEMLRTVLPWMFLMFFLINLFSPGKDMMLNFEPNEISFLFTGPFTRRQLLLYKIVDMTIRMLFSAFIFAVVSMQYTYSFWVAFIGFALLLSFLILLDIAVVLIQQNLSLHSTLKWLAAAAALSAVVYTGWFGIDQSVISGPVDLVRQLDSTWLGATLTAPFDIFARLVTAESLYPEWLLSLAGALCLMAVFVVVILALDKNYLEISFEVSQRMYQRRQKAMSGGVWGGGLSGSDQRRRVLMLPFWGGAGPVAWKQLNSAWRQWKSVLKATVLPLAIMITFFGYNLYVDSDGDGEMIGMMSFMVFFMSILVTQQVRFDFRSDFEQMEWLKQMPLSPFAVAAGQLVTPVLIFMALVGLCGALTIGVAGEWLYLGIGMLFSLPMALLMYEVENLFFLLYPIRIQPNSGADLQFIGRIYVLMFLKLILVAVSGSVAAGLGYLTYWIINELAPGPTAWLAPLAAFGVGFACMMMAAAVMFAALVWAYIRFDISIDQPA